MDFVADKCKIHKDANSEDKDLISNLPIDLKHRILDGMVINDAAKTSVLSKTWRNIWETYPSFNLNSQFFNRLVYNNYRQPFRNKFLEAVYLILFAHRGPILKLHLYIPPGLRLHESPFLHFWMKQMSESGIQELNINNPIQNPIITVPSQLFSCSKLVRLMLTNCKVNPPLNPGGFDNLTVVRLVLVTLTSDVSFGPRIKVLYLLGCTGIQHLASQFKYHSRYLCKLVIARNEMWENLALDLEFNPVTNETKSFNLYRLLGHIPSVAELTLNGVCLQFLEPGLPLHKKLSTDMGNLKKLNLCKLKFDEMRQISNAFCLIRSSPNLQVLILSVNPEANWNLVECRTEQYLESPESKDIILDQIQFVEIRDVMGSRAELLFIKLVLAIAPSLKRMRLVASSRMNDPGDGVRILGELLQCPKRSPLKVFWNGTTYT